MQKQNHNESLERLKQEYHKLKASLTYKASLRPPWLHRETFSKNPKNPKQQVLVAHACNSNYPGGRNEEDCGSKPAWANSLRDPILKKSITKKGWCSASRCRP
jgi:hypothetical protein